MKRAAAITPLIQTAAQNRLIQPQAAQQLLQNPGAVTDDQLKQFQHGLTVSAAFTTAAARQAGPDRRQQAQSRDEPPELALRAFSGVCGAWDSSRRCADSAGKRCQQAAKKAGAEESARMPGEMALAAQRQALSQGDPKSRSATACHRADATLSELKSRGATPEFIAKTLYSATRRAAQTTTRPPQKRSSMSRNRRRIQAFFGSAGSLVSKGGTLDQLAEAAAKDIPRQPDPGIQQHRGRGGGS